MRNLCLCLYLLCTMLLSGPAAAQRDIYIPSDLRPWQAWVLEDQAEIVCPYAYNDYDDKMCIWATGLDLRVNRAGATFTQQWTIFSRSRIFLPGSAETWPQDVTVDGRQVPVAMYSDRPVIYLEKGQYAVRGKFFWSMRPKYLQIPENTALISLELDGVKIGRLNVDEAGKLWFGGAAVPGRSETVRNEQDVRVYRQLLDEIPLRIITEVHLNVSGQDRELVMGRMLPADAKVIRLESDLPARIEKDGSLRVQVTTGSWVVRMHSRQTAPVTGLSMERLDAVWPEQEIWVFHVAPELRTVELTGAPSIDPQQSDLPADWKSLPAYLMTPGTVLNITEKSRGDVSPNPNRLSMGRTFWLDFDGKGFTIKDHIMGDVSRGRRMNMRDGFRLGRADLGGEPQLITVGTDSVPGLEVREGTIELDAVSRYDEGKTGIPATGWDSDMQSLRAALHLPPGWSLLHAGGPDSAYGSLVSQWSIWDLFLVFIIAVIMVKLLGPAWGMIAGVTLLLTYQVPKAPVYTWVNLAAVLFVLKVVPEGRFRKIMVRYRNIGFLILFGWVLTFSVSQIRKGLYPQLERQENGIGSFLSGFRDNNMIMKDFVAQNVAPPPPPKRRPPRVRMKTQREVEPNFSVKPPSVQPKLKIGGMESCPGRMMDGLIDDIGSSSSPAYSRKRMDRLDAAAKIQTGPGEPDWSWREIDLRWSGPVARDQRLNLFLISPAVNRLLNFLRVTAVISLTVALLFRAAGKVLVPREVKRLLARGLVAGAALFLPVLLLMPVPAQAAFPSDSLLSDLKTRLTRPPDCGNACATMSRGTVTIRNSGLSIRLELDAAGDVYVPLPARRDAWFPRSVLLDGKPARALDDMGKEGLMAALTRGRHTVVLEGPVTGTSVEVPFPFAAHNVRVEARGWDYSGLIKGRVPGGSLQFTKQADAGSRMKKEKALLPDPVEPFLEIERYIVLDREWTVRTAVRRIAPEYGAVNIEVPLLPDESVLSAGITAAGNRVKVTMASSQQEFTWESALKKTAFIRLAAAADRPWVEIWKVDAAARWHTRYDGIARIKQNVETGMVPEWQPWPGETLSVAVTRPEALEGATRTIEKATLTYETGKRSSTADLDLEIRSGQGGKMTVTLPEYADVQQLKIDFNEQVISRQKNEVTVLLKPGMQHIGLTWKDNTGASFFSKTPAVDLHGPVTNINLAMQVPLSRWTLIVGGPRLGPAMLYWGMLVVLIILAFILGRLPLSPVKTWQWLLIFIGMSTVSRFGGLFIIAWFFALARRKTAGKELNPGLFNLMQIGLIILTVIALVSIIKTVPEGLLSLPDMQITGNGSLSDYLKWYQDRATGQLPYGWTVSLPIWVYRAVMLAWSLWLAFSLIGWIKWGWECFSSQAVWKKKPVLETGETEVAVQPAPGNQGNDPVEPEG